MKKDAKLVDNLLDPAIKKVPTRNGFGEGLVIAGEKNKEVVVLCADLAESTRVLSFMQKFPERYIEVGVAEQNMAAVASGLAAIGKIPFITSYAMFSPGRNWEQIRTTIAYNERHVIIAAAHAGISVGPDGATHQALEDIGIMRIMPSMTVIVPCDSVETKKATQAVVPIEGPVYLRFAREKTPVFTTEETNFEIGQAEIFREGNDCAIIACGPMVYEALVAAEKLSSEGIDCRVVNSHTIKPLDEKTILRAAQDCGCIVTAEEAQYFAGLGGAVAELVSAKFPVPVKRVGVKDRFGESGAPDELMEKFGLKASDIMSAVREAVEMKLSHASELAKNIPEARSPVSAKLAKPVAQEFYFKLADGSVLKSVRELLDSLQKMDDSTFKHHVSQQKNDFSNWIRDVYKNEPFAKQVARQRTKQQLVDALRKALQ